MHHCRVIVGMLQGLLPKTTEGVHRTAASTRLEHYSNMPAVLHMWFVRDTLAILWMQNAQRWHANNGSVQILKWRMGNDLHTWFKVANLYSAAQSSKLACSHLSSGSCLKPQSALLALEPLFAAGTPSAGPAGTAVTDAAAAAVASYASAAAVWMHRGVASAARRLSLEISIPGASFKARLVACRSTDTACQTHANQFQVSAGGAMEVYVQ